MADEVNNSVILVKTGEVGGSNFRPAIDWRGLDGGGREVDFEEVVV